MTDLTHSRCYDCIHWVCNNEDKEKDGMCWDTCAEDSCGRFERLPPRLLPCPFCGGRAQNGFDDYDDRTGASMVWVRCWECGVIMRDALGRMTMEQMIEKWNKRTMI